jgi:DnaJ-domain-containing protein 1
VEYKKYKLEITPALEAFPTATIKSYFDTKNELLVAKNSCSNLLLFIQDELAIMYDYSNIFELSEWSEDTKEYEHINEEDLEECS